MFLESYKDQKVVFYVFLNQQKKSFLSIYKQFPLKILD